MSVDALSFSPPEIKLESIQRTVLVTDARNSSKAYFSDKADEALVRIERDRALFAQYAAAFGGEEVRDRGDGSMFAFLDPVCAVKAAMAMQAEIARLNAALPPESLSLVHRMGIQMGDIKLVTTCIVIDGEESVRRKLSGDMVVTAARLEGICHPGEVCFSNEVYKVIRGEIVHEFRCIGTTLKGFDRPIRYWSSRLDREWARPLTAEEEQRRQKQIDERRFREKWDDEQRANLRRRRALRIAAPVAAVALLFGGVAYARTDPRIAHKMDLAWSALLGDVDARAAFFDPSKDGKSVVANGRPSTDDAPVALHRPVPAPKASLQAQVSRIVRRDLLTGDYGKLRDDFEQYDTVPGFVSQIIEEARSLEAVKVWLLGRKFDEGEKITLLSPVDGMVRLTGISDEQIVGEDRNGDIKKVGFGRFRAHDLFVLVNAVEPAAAATPDVSSDDGSTGETAGGDPDKTDGVRDGGAKPDATRGVGENPPPSTPEQCATALSHLRRVAGLKP